MDSLKDFCCAGFFFGNCPPPALSKYNGPSLTASQMTMERREEYRERQ